MFFPYSIPHVVPQPVQFDVDKVSERGNNKRFTGFKSSPSLLLFHYTRRLAIDKSTIATAWKELPSTAHTFSPPSHRYDVTITSSLSRIHGNGI